MEKMLYLVIQKSERLKEIAERLGEYEEARRELDRERYHRKTKANGWIVSTRICQWRCITNVREFLLWLRGRNESEDGGPASRLARGRIEMSEELGEWRRPIEGSAAVV